MKRRYAAGVAMGVMTGMIMCQGSGVFYAQDETQEEMTIWEALGEDAENWADQFDVSSINEMVYRMMGEELVEYTVSDPDMIEAVYQALDEVTVMGTTDVYATDAGDMFCFENQDGSIMAVEFSMACLYADGIIYETYHTEDLWDLTYAITQPSFDEESAEENDASGIKAISITENDAEEPMVDTGNLTVHAARGEWDDNGDYRLKMTVTNHTSEPVRVFVGNTAVNDCMCDIATQNIAEQMADADETIEMSVVWPQQELAKRGITEIDSALLELLIYGKTADADNGKLTESGLYELQFTDPELMTETAKPEPVAIEGVDAVGYCFDVLELGQDEDGYPLWKVWLENDTDDTVVFELKDCVINGYATDPSWECTVLPGRKALSEVSWWTMDMNAARFKAIQDAQLILQVSCFDEEGERQEVYMQTVSYHPEGETAVYETEDEDEQIKGLVLSQHETATVVLTDIEYSASEGYYILEMKLVNNSAQKLRFSSESITIGDYEMNPGWLETAPASSVRECTMALDLSDHKDLLTSRVQELDLDLQVMNDDGDLLVDDLCRVNPSKFMMIRTESRLGGETA